MNCYALPHRQQINCYRFHARDGVTEYPCNYPCNYPCDNRATGGGAATPLIPPKGVSPLEGWDTPLKKEKTHTMRASPSP